MTKLDRALHAQHELRVIAIMITPGEFPGLARKIRSALASADGAVRNAKRFAEQEARKHAS